MKDKLYMGRLSLDREVSHSEMCKLARERLRTMGDDDNFVFEKAVLQRGHGMQWIVYKRFGAHQRERAGS